MPERTVTYSPPNLPWTVRAGGLLYRGFERLGLRRFRLPDEQLLAAARSATGLSDFGDPGFREPLGHILRALESEARLSLSGQLWIRRKLVSLLAGRLYLHRDLRLHPEILEVPLPTPVVVLGTPRSGTTLLQSLLAQDPGCRVLRHWELREPWPEQRDGWSEAADPRPAAQEAEMRNRIRLLPHLHAMHPFDAPPECDELFTSTFYSTRFSFGYDIPSYDAWLDPRGPAAWQEPYRSYRRSLQHLAWWQGGSHWVLKSPHHLRHLDNLLAVFPDVCAVQLHRDPQKVVASTCSLTASARGIVSDRVDLGRVGRFVMGKLTDLVDKGLEARRRLPAARFFDLPYRQLLADPVASVERLYAHFGLPFTPAFAAGMRAWLAGNPQHKDGRHRYALAPFGLDPGEVEAAFTGYCAHFEVPREAAA
jgi:hypothetical protein